MSTRARKEWRIVPRGLSAWDLLHNEKHVARFASLGAARAGLETEQRRAKARAAKFRSA